MWLLMKTGNEGGQACCTSDHWFLEFGDQVVHVVLPSEEVSSQKPSPSFAMALASAEAFVVDSTHISTSTEGLAAPEP